MALIVDDAHWLDRSTLGVLSFISRRLEGESAVLIVAVRDGCVNPFREARLPSVRLERLSAAASAELLDQSVRICTLSSGLACWSRPRGTRLRLSSWLVLCHLRRVPASGSRRRRRR